MLESKWETALVALVVQASAVVMIMATRHGRTGTAGAVVVEAIAAMVIKPSLCNTRCNPWDEAAHQGQGRV